jgi:hypothetical protein
MTEDETGTTGTYIDHALQIERANHNYFWRNLNGQRL